MPSSMPFHVAPAEDGDERIPLEHREVPPGARPCRRICIRTAASGAGSRIPMPPAIARRGTTSRAIHWADNVSGVAAAGSGRTATGLHCRLCNGGLGSRWLCSPRASRSAGRRREHPAHPTSGRPSQRAWRTSTLRTRHSAAGPLSRCQARSLSGIRRIPMQGRRQTGSWV